MQPDRDVFQRRHFDEEFEVLKCSRYLPMVRAPALERREISSLPKCSDPEVPGKPRRPDSGAWSCPLHSGPISPCTVPAGDGEIHTVDRSQRHRTGASLLRLRAAGTRIGRVASRRALLAAKGDNGAVPHRHCTGSGHTRQHNARQARLRRTAWSPSKSRRTPASGSRRSRAKTRASPRPPPRQAPPPPSCRRPRSPP